MNELIQLLEQDIHSSDRLSLLPNHIFFEFKRHYTPICDSKEILAMYSFFLKNEMSLDLLRGRKINGTKIRNIQGAEEIIRDLINSKDNFSANVSDGMQSFFSAMYSYYLYVTKKNGDAVENLDFTLQKTISQAKKFPLFILAYPTQVMNLVVIYIYNNNFEKASDLISKLFSILFDGMQADTTVKEIYKQVGNIYTPAIVEDVIFTTIYTMKRTCSLKKICEFLLSTVKQTHIDNTSYGVMNGYFEVTYNSINALEYFVTGQFNEYVDATQTICKQSIRNIPHPIKELYLDVIGELQEVNSF